MLFLKLAAQVGANSHGMPLFMGAITRMVKQKIRRCEICVSAKSAISSFSTLLPQRLFQTNLQVSLASL